jgi:hypothetical protein
MPAWIWLFLVVIIAYGGLVLWRAWNKKYVKFGPIHYTAEESPVYFWFLAVVFFLSEMFAIGLFGITIISAIWGPIVHQ